MSFSSVDNKIQYATDGIVDTFAFNNPFQQTSDLVVQLKDNTTLLVTTLVESVDYDVTTVGDTGRFTSGSVVTTSVLASGSTISIIRIVENNQEDANFNPGGEFDEQTVEDAFDKGIMTAQQLYNLAVLLKKSGNVAGPVEFPDLADNAGKLLQINSAGDGFTASDSATSSDARVNSLFNGAASDDIFATFINLLNGALILDGTGDPEGVHVAPVGSIFLRTNGGAGTSIYFKETGAGDTGWKQGAPDFTELSAKSSGAKTLLAGQITELLELDIGTVTAGDRIQVTGQARTMIKGATAGITGISLAQKSGTATTVFMHDDNSLDIQDSNVPISGSAGLQVNGTIKVTGSGTLVLILSATSAGSNSSMGDGLAQIYAYFIRKS